MNATVANNDFGAMKKTLKLNSSLAKASASRHIKCISLPNSRR